VPTARGHFRGYSTPVKASQKRTILFPTSGSNHSSQKEKAANDGLFQDQTIDPGGLSQTLKDYYRERGWDPMTGYPSKRSSNPWACPPPEKSPKVDSSAIQTQTMEVHPPSLPIGRQAFPLKLREDEGG